MLDGIIFAVLVLVSVSLHRRLDDIEKKLTPPPPPVATGGTVTFAPTDEP